MKTNDFPTFFFDKEKSPWRPGIHQIPVEPCTAQIPTMIKTGIDNIEYRQHIRDNFLPEFKAELLLTLHSALVSETF